MLPRSNLRVLRRIRFPTLHGTHRAYHFSSTLPTRTVLSSNSSHARLFPVAFRKSFHASTHLAAQSPSADVLMENLNDLYATAKDEFEIAAEETEKKTVYASDDREAAKQALDTLKKAFEKAVKESDPEVAKEVQGRVGSRIRELENAITAMEEMAMED